MGHVHVSAGDIVEVYGVGQFLVEILGNEREGEVAFFPRNLCRGCERNDVDDPETLPFCVRCILDAQLHAALARIVDNVGDENVPVARVLSWDEENRRRANSTGEQYIDLESSALDWISGMSPQEFRDEFVSYIARSLPEYMRDAVASKLT